MTGVDADRIGQSEMARLRAAGEAVPLLGEYEIGPTWYAGAWWYAPPGTPEPVHYVHADAEGAAQLSLMRSQLDGAAARVSALAGPPGG